VRGLARNQAAIPSRIEPVEWFSCQLPDRVDENAFAGGVEALIHCAYETRFVNPERARAVNLEGSKRLFESARRHGVKRIVFVSSLSAHEGAVSFYGRSKLEVEGLLDPERDVAIRPGHILGEGGVFWRTAYSIRKLPLIPLFFGGNQKVQTIALSDVCEAIQLTLEKGVTGVVRVAVNDALSLREFYSAVAACMGKRPVFVPLPGGFALHLLRLAERLGFSLPLSSDNLMGLKQLRTFDVRADLERLGLRPRTTQETLAEIRWDRL
jgi:nucleoside-diphosphate-sugar epimerase